MHAARKPMQTFKREEFNNPNDLRPACMPPLNPLSDRFLKLSKVIKITPPVNIKLITVKLQLKTVKNFGKGVIS